MVAAADGAPWRHPYCAAALVGASGALHPAPVHPLTPLIRPLTPPPSDTHTR